VVVNTGKSDVLVGQVLQFVDRGVDFEAAVGDGVEEDAQALLFDDAVSLWCADS
jgi:hypothetical protein